MHGSSKRSSANPFSQCCFLRNPRKDRTHAMLMSGKLRAWEDEEMEGIDTEPQKDGFFEIVRDPLLLKDGCVTV